MNLRLTIAPMKPCDIPLELPEGFRIAGPDGKEYGAHLCVVDNTMSVALRELHR